MRYQIPTETLPGWKPHLAVNPLTPIMAGFLAGTFPSLVWMALNGIFLGCRDWRKQAAVAAVGFLAIRTVTVASILASKSSAISAALGKHVTLLTSMLGSISLLLLYGLLMWMSTRQEEIAGYQSSLGKKISWGLVPLGILTAFNIFGVPIVDTFIPYFARFWGRII